MGVAPAASGGTALHVFVFGCDRRSSCFRASSPVPRSMRACRAASSTRLGAAADHPVALEFPEGGYLKGLVVARKRRNDR